MASLIFGSVGYSFYVFSKFSYHVDCHYPVVVVNVLQNYVKA